MTERQLKDRTKKLALRVIDFVEALPHTRSAEVLGRQLLRSGTSVGANYRSACRGRSDADMSSKLGIVEEEADESQYWIELLKAKCYGDDKEGTELCDEFDEIISIMVSSRRTLRDRIAKSGNKLR
jgi:four helix bundle protein